MCDVLDDDDECVHHSIEAAAWPAVDARRGDGSSEALDDDECAEENTAGVPVVCSDFAASIIARYLDDC